MQTTLTMRTTIELLQAEADEETESYFRLLIDKKTVKYITIAAGIYDIDDMCFGPQLVEILPELPPGDWNTGHVDKGIQNNEPIFTRTEKIDLPGIQNTWHAVRWDHLDLTFGRYLRTGVYEVKSPMLYLPAVAKFARFDWEIPAHDRETAAYEWIKGQGIGPEFLGHMVEEGRVIGFLMSQVSDVRHASIDDLGACQTSLEKLHRLGILHGDINRHNFLMTGSGATIVDFSESKRCNDSNVLEEEMQGLQASLLDESGKGGRLVLE